MTSLFLFIFSLFGKFCPHARVKFEQYSNTASCTKWHWRDSRRRLRAQSGHAPTHWTLSVCQNLGNESRDLEFKPVSGDLEPFQLNV